MALFRRAILTGLSKTYSLMDRRKRLNIITLHRIDQQNGSSAVAKIRDEIEYLSQQHRFILPADLEQMESFDQNLAMITVDDGHDSLYTHLYPLFKAKNIPFTPCLPTDFMFREAWLWFDKLEYIFKTTSDLADPATRKSFNDLLVSLKATGKDEREEALNKIARDNSCEVPPSPTPDYAPLSSGQVNEMLDSGLMEITAHGVSHTIMTLLNDEDLREELAASKRELESVFGREINCFCYPNGLEGDFDDRTEKAIRESGYRSALTSVEGSNIVKGLDPYGIKRIHTGLDRHSFVKETAGLGDIQKSLPF
ncbi:MAG: polysaccharide deacetylase family protein [Gammaproteobacteria bacterium]|nr:polysaccharide deacetylase family protein [Gammaproteobacteria bacterium]